MVLEYRNSVNTSIFHARTKFEGMVDFLHSDILNRGNFRKRGDQTNYFITSLNNVNKVKILAITDQKVFTLSKNQHILERLKLRLGSMADLGLILRS